MPAWLSAQIPAGDQWQQCHLVLHALDHRQYQFLSWHVGALALALDGQAAARGSRKREPPACEHSDWLDLSVWRVVVRVQGCYQAVAWMLEQVIAVAFALPAQALDPGLRLIGDPEESDVGLLPWGSTPCGGSVLLTSSSTVSMSSCAGRVSGEAG